MSPGSDAVGTLVLWGIRACGTYRGSDFVGHLRIEEVDDNASAGVIYDVREGMSVHQNDRVTNKFE